MKRFFILMMMIFMALSMIACSNDQAQNVETPEERETTLKESKYGFNMIILPGFVLKESETGKSYISMDTNKDFEVRIASLAKDLNPEEWKKSVEAELKEEGEIVELDPTEHTSSFLHDAYYYLTNEEKTLGYILKEIEGKIFEFRIFDPSKDAFADRSPVWLMLETIKVKD